MNATGISLPAALLRLPLVAVMQLRAPLMRTQMKKRLPVKGGSRL